MSGAFPEAAILRLCPPPCLPRRDGLELSQTQAQAALEGKAAALGGITPHHPDIFLLQQHHLESLPSACKGGC